jgi:nucleoside-diphosphate-sugar epimerase
VTPVNSTSHAVAEVLDAYRGVRVLVLGASGFIGRWVARRLTEVQARLIVAVRQPAEFAGVARHWKINADVIPWDALVDTAVADSVAAVAPDIVFNLAGYGVDRSETDPVVMARINEELVRQLADAVVGTKPTIAWSGGRRLVHAGSALEYGLIPGVATEDGPAMPHTLYGQTKLAGTLALRAVAEATGLPSVTARLFTVYGPGEHPGRLLPSLRRAARDGEAVKLSSGTQRRDFTYVDDVAEGLLRLGISAGTPGEAVNLATGHLTSVREFAESAALVLKLPRERLLFGTESIRPDEMQITGVDVARLGQRTHWTPDPDPDRGIRRAVGFEAALEQVSLSAD